MRPAPPIAFDLPDAAAQAHAERVAGALREAIAAAGGALWFDDYMEFALYAPGLGYYAAGARKFGADGDFITAPEVSPLFGRALARQVAEAQTLCGGDTVLELGPGSGALAAALIPELAVLGATPTRVLLLEPSPDLRERQQARLAPLAHLTRLEWIDRLPAAPIAGTILANEVLDAVPCERFVVRGGTLQEQVVVTRGTGFALEEREARPVTRAALRAVEVEIGLPFAEGFAHERRARLAPLVATLARALGRGLLLFVDYGLGRRELYAPARGTGTFRAHHRQRTFSDALLHPGLCDLTAWVDFTAVAEAATAEGLALAGYTTQAHLLFGCGLQELLDEPLPGSEPESIARARRSRDVQRLTLPDEMGERFKAIGFTRGMAVPLRGFGFRDLAHLL